MKHGGNSICYCYASYRGAIRLIEEIILLIVFQHKSDPKYIYKIATDG